jgi:hypothetical protein
VNVGYPTLDRLKFPDVFDLDAREGIPHGLG